ncbi:Allergen V5/Tpx-1 family protein [Acidothermus cellulolyticus 11B]|uniref:Allergen V5/Tpx-1 family protein n=1 Tax=Acidothermus cellulolyticus (strain ATCC 43068 / DSM 8971 / 11B) TaxID=351607 RepID=A0LRF6_ACIC1|nr:CAP domain-containing protein [Acidothermus cellulolyticus]ABK52016.1 Allergen V5/Tpx-1 family protein [Acidothermus cellulolyticus 11B]
MHVAAFTRRAGLRLGSGIACLSVIFTGILAAASPAWASPASELAAATNAARLSAGLPALSVDAGMSAVAQSWANHLAATQVLAHNPQVQTQISNWVVLGENVGMAMDIPSVQQAFMKSAEHRDNILNPAFTQMGVGAASSTYPSCGCTVLWVVVDFRRPMTTAPSSPVPPAPRTASPLRSSAPVPPTRNQPQPQTPAATSSSAPVRAAVPASAVSTGPAPDASPHQAAPPPPSPADSLGTGLAEIAASPSPPLTAAPDPVSRLLTFVSLVTQLSG